MQRKFFDVFASAIGLVVVVALVVAGSLLMWGYSFANSNVHNQLAEQQIVFPSAAAFAHPVAGQWLKKFYSVNEEWVADDRRKLLAFARDLLNSDYAGHRLTFQLFAQSPPFAHLAAVYNNFDWSGPLEFVRKSAGLSERVLGKKAAKSDAWVIGAFANSIPATPIPSNSSTTIYAKWWWPETSCFCVAR